MNKQVNSVSVMRNKKTQVSSADIIKPEELHEFLILLEIPAHLGIMLGIPNIIFTLEMLGIQ